MYRVRTYVNVKRVAIAPGTTRRASQQIAVHPSPGTARLGWPAAERSTMGQVAYLLDVHARGVSRVPVRSRRQTHAVGNQRGRALILRHEHRKMRRSIWPRRHGSMHGNWQRAWGGRGRQHGGLFAGQDRDSGGEASAGCQTSMRTSAICCGCGAITGGATLGSGSIAAHRRVDPR